MISMWPPPLPACSKRQTSSAFRRTFSRAKDSPMTVTILTVDDSRTMRDMLRMALVDAGFRVVQAEDGLHGLDVLRQETPHVVITDINMPRMDGFGFIEAVRQDQTLPRRADPGAHHRERRRQEDARPARRAPRAGSSSPSTRRSWSPPFAASPPERRRTAHGRDGRNQADLLPGMRGAARSPRERPAQHAGGRDAIRKPSTRCSAPCIRSRAAPAPSSSMRW